MCGIAAAFEVQDPAAAAAAIVDAQRHRGPDAQDLWHDAESRLVLGHDRLAIRDLSDAGIQPMHDPSGRYVVSFNGEILNDAELRSALESRVRFRTRTDTEVLLAAWARWGEDCLERLIGFFAFLLYDRRERTLWAVRDRFGVKPLYLHRPTSGGVLAASEISALITAGAPPDRNDETWAAYLARGVHDEGRRTFWRGIERLEAGCLARYRAGELTHRRWYDGAARMADVETRDEAAVIEDYRALLEDSVRLRFRSDVPVGINLSGGVDSSLLLALVHRLEGEESDVAAFTFTCGDDRYDELPWVEQMLDQTRHPLVVAQLTADAVPDLATDVHRHQLEPFGGLPTLAYARLFEHARRAGVIVLLDGQGMDEQWAGYDYYAQLVGGATLHGTALHRSAIQGSAGSPTRPDCLVPEALALDAPATSAPSNPTSWQLTASTSANACAVRDRQLRDLFETKLPRALRFNDRVSMRASCELREPFLDHRLVELAMRQPLGRKRRGATGKVLLRQIARDLTPKRVAEAPKRALQTPQREWLRGPLRDWAEAMIDRGIEHSGMLDRRVATREWQSFLRGEIDQGFFAWQWISLGLDATWLHGDGAHIGSREAAQGVR